MFEFLSSMARRPDVQMIGLGLVSWFAGRFTYAGWEKWHNWKTIRKANAEAFQRERTLRSTPAPTWKDWEGR